MIYWAGAGLAVDDYPEFTIILERGASDMPSLNSSDSLSACRVRLDRGRRPTQLCAARLPMDLDIPG
jgi:hypothetical protein